MIPIANTSENFSLLNKKMIKAFNSFALFCASYAYTLYLLDTGKPYLWMTVTLPFLGVSMAHSIFDMFDGMKVSTNGKK